MGGICAAVSDGFEPIIKSGKIYFKKNKYKNKKNKKAKIKQENKIKVSFLREHLVRTKMLIENMGKV